MESASSGFMMNDADGKGVISIGRNKVAMSEAHSLRRTALFATAAFEVTKSPIYSDSAPWSFCN
jgi:hypothetical protein